MSRRRLLLGAILLVALAVVLWRISRSRTFMVFGELVARVSLSEKVVALTFDDGPIPGATEKIAGVLAAEGVKASFFLVGRELEAHPELGRMLVDAGHEIGNHSYSHQRMVLKTPSFVASEIERTDALIRALGYQGPILFRPPYGKKLFVLPWYLARTGRLNVIWDLEPESDASLDGDAEKIAAHVIEHAVPGSIILLHVMYPGREASLAAVPLIIRGLRERQFSFDTVSGLLVRAGERPAG